MQMQQLRYWGRDIAAAKTKDLWKTEGWGYRNSHFSKPTLTLQPRGSKYEYNGLLCCEAV